MWALKWRWIWYALTWIVAKKCTNLANSPSLCDDAKTQKRENAKTRFTLKYFLLVVRLLCAPFNPSDDMYYTKAFTVVAKAGRKLNFAIFGHITDLTQHQTRSWILCAAKNFNKIINSLGQHARLNGFFNECIISGIKQCRPSGHQQIIIRQFSFPKKIRKYSIGKTAKKTCCGYVCFNNVLTFLRQKKQVADRSRNKKGQNLVSM